MKGVDRASTNTQKQGQMAENAALEHLRSHGLRLVTRNFRCKLGELDLIMQDGEALVFVEVRYRSDHRHGFGADTVDYYKRQKIIRAAEYFLLQRQEIGDCVCRFDVVSASGSPRHPGSNARPQPMELEWLKGAFEVE